MPKNINIINIAINIIIEMSIWKLCNAIYCNKMQIIT